nr:hypothetical protein asmbl_4 [uncultured bacterium]
MTLALASSGCSVQHDAGDHPGHQLSTAATLLIFIGIPILLFAVIAVLVALPSLLRGPKYRPGAQWAAEPVWYGGPGARASEELTAVPATNLASTQPSEEVGGASARW